MPKFPLALCAALGLLATLATSTVAQTFPSNLPMAITCSDPTKGWRIGYIIGVNANGDAIYMGAGRLTATVNAKGVVLAPSSRPAALDSYGKTVDELRAMGRVMDFQRAR